MKTISDKATNAFQKLGQELGATVVIKETLLDFDMLLFENQEVYLWDRKHRTEKVDTPSGYPNLGWAILQSSSKKENTRFSCVAIHNKSENAMDVYQATMQDVKMWKAYLEVRNFDDYDSYITSYCGVSGSV